MDEKAGILPACAGTGISGVQPAGNGGSCEQNHLKERCGGAFDDLCRAQLYA